MTRGFLRYRSGLLRPAASIALVALVLSGSAVGAAPVSGFVSGQITAVKDGSFVLEDSFGAVPDSTVAVSKTSSIIKQIAVSRSDLKIGNCVVVSGQKASNGTVDADRLTISAAVKGKCSTDFGFGSGHRPRGASRGNSSNGSSPITAPARGSFSGFANFAFAAGAITAIDGNNLEVKGSSLSKVLLSSSTSLMQMKSVDASAIAAEECATVRGTSADNGANVTATSIQLSEPGANGCNRGFPGRAG